MAKGATKTKTRLLDNSGLSVNPATEDSQTNGLQKTQNIDLSGRLGLNTVFGEQITGRRVPTIAAQFQYGFPASTATPTVVGSGTISIVDSMLVLSTGTDTNGSAILQNKRALRYLPGHEAYMVFTAVFSSPKPNSTQRAGLYDDENGFFIGYENETFCASRRRDSVDTNHGIVLDDVFAGFDPTKGNVYRISFGYLGFATIHFEVMTPTGGWTSLYEIEYPNTSTETHILNTNIPPRAEVTNTGNSTDISIKSGSFSAGVVDGAGAEPSSRYFSFSQSDISVTAGNDMIFTLRSKSTFNGIANYIQSILTFFSINSDLSKSSLWELRKNMTITNTPTWADINTNDSTTEYSLDATVTANTGDIVFSLPLGKVDRAILEDFEKQEVDILPGDTLTLSIKTPVGTSGTYDASVRIKELF